MQRQQARTQWCVSSAWLECRPVTAEVMGSSPIHTARPLRNSGGAFAVNMAILGWLAHPKKYVLQGRSQRLSLGLGSTKPTPYEAQGSLNRGSEANSADNSAISIADNPVLVQSFGMISYFCLRKALPIPH